MAITINGSGTVTGLAVGGLPDNVVDKDTLAVGVQSKVLQVVSADIGTFTSSTAQSWVDTNASISITPKFTTSRIVCMFNFGFGIFGATRVRGGFQLLRGSTVIAGGSTETTHFNELAVGGEGLVAVALNSTDSPATTSATTYKIQIYAHTSGMTAQLLGQGNTRPGHMILMEIGV